MNLSEYHLSVKEFATICHTTRDTLRHYYENGIIEPFVDPENGYHYYSPSQISAFFYVLSLKNVGCSLKEIKSMMQSTDPSLYQSILKAKANELRQRIADLNVGLTTISTYDWMLDLVEQGRTTGQVACYEIPQVYITETPITSENAYHMKDVTKELTVHLKNLNQKSNIFPIGATISLDRFLKRDYAYQNIFSLSLSMPNPGLESSYQGPSKKILAYTPEASEDILFSYHKFEDYLKKNKISPKSDLFIVNLMNLYTLNREHSYLKYLFLFL